MAAESEIVKLIQSGESDSVEFTTSTNNTEKFSQAICAFANDLPNHRKPGYTLVGLYDDGKLEMVYNYPYWALRELAMNAVMHRDYQSNTPIRLYQFDDRIEIMNAGNLYGNARPENFPNVNDYRNPIIAEAMKVLGYVNRFSRGVNRVNQELVANGNPEAYFKFNLLTVFEVTVKLSQKSLEGRTTQKASNVQKAILELLAASPSLSREGLAQQIGNITADGIKYHLDQLKRKGLITRVGGRKEGAWLVNTDTEN